MVIKINTRTKFSENSSLERFNRQTRIPEWGEKEQKKIFNKKTLIVGESVLGEMTLAGLASFGARNLFYLDYVDYASRKSYFSHVKESGTRLEKIVKTVSKINPHSTIYGYKGPFSRFFLNLEHFQPEIIIDATNNLESKETILDYLENNKETKLISAISNPSACAVSFYDPLKENYEDILNPKINIIRNMQGGFTSNIATGLIIEEFRKNIFNLNKNDKNTEETIYYSLKSSKRNSPKDDFKLKKYYKNGNILVAGCGGIGTYVGLSLSQEGFKNISFLDMDIVEDTNLNRQILFYDNIGEKKNLSLSRKLKDNFNIKPMVFFGELNDSCGKLFEKNEYDLILGCFDNNNARFFLNNYAVKYEIPYIDGAVTYKNGEITSYIPKKTACLKCKKGLEFEEEIEDNSCNNALPSVIPSNMIIGSAMVGESINYLSEKYQNIRLRYNTEKSKKIKAYPEKTKIKECNHSE